MKKIFTLMIAAVMVFAGCQKYDDSALRGDVNELKNRVAALEAWQATANSNITALQGLVDALQERRYITNVTPFDTPAPGGYTITFSTGAPITISNGEKGDNGEPGATPQIGVAEYPANSGVYYWTLNSVFIEINGQKLPVTGPKGEDGTPGITPKLRINAATNEWEVCLTGDCAEDSEWTSLDIKATGEQGDAIFAANGVDNSHPDYVVFTLANGGGTITLPKYRAIAIHFTQPEKFAENDVQTVPYTLTGNVEHVKVMSVTPDWTVTHTQTGDAGTFTITAPATFTLDNEAGEAVLLISDGAERTVMRTIALVRIDYLVADVDAIVAGTEGGDYHVLLASNASWTAAVSAEGDGWCTVTPTSGTGRGTLTITLAASTLEAPDRSATVTITAGTLTQTVAVTQMLIPVPTYAASNQTWTFGTQTWSDAIHIPECNKDGFASSAIDPQCRSHTSGTNTWYYYNWSYVNQHAAQLCPSPWRVPAKNDFDVLVGATDVSTLILAWGFGGYTGNGLMFLVDSLGHFWSSTEDNTSNASALYYTSSDLYTNVTLKHYGFQVRCVQ
ncbi:MAG: hypothetical protein LBN98_05545 [Prevotellaceae bacterium]|jgi:hypothetical protein|nr:hypothetical protein [Prevotellaceae bacterium]